MKQARDEPNKDAALQKLKERLVNILESISDGFFSLDDELVVTYFNRVSEQLLGRKSEEVLGRNLFEAFPEARGSIFEEQYTWAVREKAFTCFTICFDVEPYENWYDVKVYPDKDGISVFFQVITDQVRAESQRDAALETLRHQAYLLENVSDAIISSDVDFEIQSWNRAAEEIYGWRADEVLGKTIGDVVQPEYPAGTRREGVIAQFLKVGYWKGEVIHKRKDGTPVHILGSVTLLKDNAGNPTGVVSANHDITERVRAESQRDATLKALKEHSERLQDVVEERTQELKKAQEQLIRREKLAVLGQLAGSVSHELRNPLGAIKNAAYLLDLVIKEPVPDAQEALRILNKEVATSERIISDLLDFARVKSPAWQRVDLNHAIQETLSRITAPDNVKVITHLDETLPTILADPHQLEQIFGNIILNAIQAMTLPNSHPTSSGHKVKTPEGGQLTIQTSAGSVGPSLASSPGWVSVSFSDTGVGISQENMDRLFEPLFTTKTRGIGLGLAITKTLVEGHGGKIEVESQEEKGSAFSVVLPTEPERERKDD